MINCCCIIMSGDHTSDRGKEQIHVMCYTSLHTQPPPPPPHTHTPHTHTPGYTSLHKHTHTG